jgi:hypothetical protein
MPEWISFQRITPKWGSYFDMTYRRIPKCQHEWVKYPRFLHDPTHLDYGKPWKERFKLENMTEDIWIPVGTKFECRLCGGYRR